VRECVNLEKRWQQDALWEEGRLAEAALCSGNVLLENLGSGHMDGWMFVYGIVLYQYHKQLTLMYPNPVIYKLLLVGYIQ